MNVPAGESGQGGRGVVQDRLERVLLQEPAGQGRLQALLHADLHGPDQAQQGHALPRALLPLQVCAESAGVGGAW